MVLSYIRNLVPALTGMGFEQYLIMKTKDLFPIFTIAIFLFPLGVFATSTDIRTSDVSELTAPRPWRSYFLNLSMSRRSPVVNHHDGHYFEQTEASAMVGLKHSKSLVSHFIVEGYKRDNRGDYSGDFSLGQLGTTWTIPGVFLDNSLAMSVGLPLSREQRLGQSLIGSVGTLFKVATNKNLFEKGSGSIGLRLNKYYYHYSTAVSGVVNKDSDVGAVADLELHLGEKLKLILDGQYLRQTYLMDGHRDVFLFSEALQYEMSQQVSVFLAHANAGQAIKNNGIESNLNFFDENGSSMEFGVYFRL